MKKFLIKVIILIGIVLIGYGWLTKGALIKSAQKVDLQVEVTDPNSHVIQAILEDNSVLREQQRQREIETLRLAKINEYIKEGNDTLQRVCELIFGEYVTYLTLTHTEDEKNIIEVGAKFKVAYSVDLMLGEFSYNEQSKQIELRLPKASVGVAYCEPASEIVTIGEKRSLLNSLMMPWEVAKREPLKSKAMNLLIRDSIDYVYKSFEDLQQEATYVVEQLIGSIPIGVDVYEAIKILWI